MNQIQTLPSLFAIGLATAASAAMAETALQNPRAVEVECIAHDDFSAAVAALKSRLLADNWILLSEIDLGNCISRHGGNTPLPGGLVILELSRSDSRSAGLASASNRCAGNFVPCRLAIHGMDDGRVRVARTNASIRNGTPEPGFAQAVSQAAMQLDATITAALGKPHVGRIRPIRSST
ncbi:MAG: hypothetical protein B7Y33_00935 [Hydrogenophilales bacterium 16-62-9]|nr:MAG: hypothetical protein B7Y33_00935 [Hydrogenophilales bacterium 16-62-9]